MRCFPTAKSSAVTRAPVATSDDASSTSGRNLKSIPKSAEVTATERMKFRVPSTTWHRRGPSREPVAQRSEGGVDAERHQQQEANRHHETERANAIEEEILQPSRLAPV